MLRRSTFAVTPHTPDQNLYWASIRRPAKRFRSKSFKWEEIAPFEVSRRLGRPAAGGDEAYQIISFSRSRQSIRSACGKQIFRPQLALHYEKTTRGRDSCQHDNVSIYDVIHGRELKATRRRREVVNGGRNNQPADSAVR